MPLEHLVKAFRKVINSKVTRSQARQILKGLLTEHGWHLLEESALGDVVGYLRSSNTFIIIKLWIRPDRAPVPKFYVENFLRSLYKTSESCRATPLFDKRICQECEKFCMLSKRVYKYFLSNAPLEQEAYNYFQTNAKGTKLVLSDEAQHDIRTAFKGEIIDRNANLNFFTPQANIDRKDAPMPRSV